MKRGNVDIKLGSEIDNEFKCKSNICEFAGWYGKDSYSKKWNNLDSLNIIKDFNYYDNDKLFISDNYEIKEKGKNTLIISKYKFGLEEHRYLLKGVKKEEVEKWLEDARNEDGLLDEEYYRKLPIQIE